jgi:DNA replication protein DnaC
MTLCDICEEAICKHPAECKAKRIYKTDKAKVFEMLNVPKKYRMLNPTWGKEEQDKIDRAIKADTHIFFSGDTGNGKTTAATQVFCHLSGESINRDGFSAIWATAPAILSDIRATFDKRSKQTEQDIINHYATAGLLLIDDIGAEQVTDWSVSAFYRLISDRINWDRKTIVTSNSRFAEIEAWNKRISSRLAGMHCVRFTGADRRLDKCRNTK